MNAGFLKFTEISASFLIRPFLIIGYCVYVSFKMQKASLSLEANPLEIHVHDFFTIEVRQSPNVSDGATTPNEELPTEKTPVQPIYPVSDDSCTNCW